MNKTYRRGEIHVFTFKEGLLSKVAHDLRLTLERFEIAVDGDVVRGRFWPGSLGVDGTMRDGKLDPKGISDKDKRDIRGKISDKVLHTSRHAEVAFEGRATTGDDGHHRIEGTLALHGRRAPLTVTTVVDDAGARGEVTLTPSQWGIAPFKALLGAIKLHDRVVVRWSVTAD